jgi:hypothetical protein
VKTRKADIEKEDTEREETSGYFNTIVKLNSFMRINEYYPKDSLKREFVTEFSGDFKYTLVDIK